jgi:OTU domain-containing protein 5
LPNYVGTEQFHREIRQLCLKYIRDERVFFQDYVTEELDDYVARKQQDGVWGDDVEIEALSEIYGRPIEIYSTSAKPLRTFHEDNEHEMEPLRLAYVGYCHYNSIKKRNRVEAGLLNTPFGEFESIFSLSYDQSGSTNDLRRYR